HRTRLGRIWYGRGLVALLIARLSWLCTVGWVTRLCAIGRLVATIAIWIVGATIWNAVRVTAWRYWLVGCRSRRNRPWSISSLRPPAVATLRLVAGAGGTCPWLLGRSTWPIGSR